MQSFNYYNSDYLLSIKPKYYKLVIIIFILIACIIISSIFIYTDDVIASNSYVECDNTCNISVSLEPSMVGKLNDIDYIYVNKQRVYHYNMFINEIMNSDNNSIYQIIEFNIDNININSKTIQELKIYYNKERLFQKIISNFFE